ncbi:hypothetical protein RDWZM_005637 [Blomia tropicalis]|uniref:Uncharacterized protein n=1 Tax=Blomia tropicalis TaxID=40697 RepID=A0A9Q0M5Z8_BLOTA|nr:hypothetical protein BLOT_006266 [Blomia tropicalis]KAJ6219825.1 hypothetical protein RDWZM_005637 [Blomia tropicalis]
MGKKKKDKDKKKDKKSTSSKTSHKGSDQKKKKKDKKVKPSKSKCSANKNKKKGSRKPDSAASNLSASVVVRAMDAVQKNQQEVNKIVALMDAIRTNQVTKHHKDDLDRIQMLIKNISYREEGLPDLVRPVTFTYVQKAIIKKITGINEKGKCDGDPKDKVPTITIPFDNLNLVPTKPSAKKKK